ncbi:serine hydrolase [Corynebacterium sp. P7003]|uniref:Serine hydrolase n=1 Tax=Corynebacterium pygosceleis TaxID=2800406 RepID=A0ABT3WS95_9CORY|nr:serine hydrolase [Corynebacterium pygosceleis]MCX7444943.1 serine hydrolase [Corynebacterium pygosceleis]
MSNKHVARSLTSAVLCGAVTLGSCTPPPVDNPPAHSAGDCPRAESPADLTTPDGWITHLAAHPDDSALVIIPDAATPDGPDTVRKNADTALDVASAAKIIHLLAYADAVADGSLDPDERVPVAEWEAFYLPLDGGAHAAALERLGMDRREPSPGVAVATDPDATVTLDDLVSTMIVESDNAAADWLAEELGPETLEAAAVKAGWDNPRIPDYLGSMLAILDPELAGDPAAASRRYREDAEWAADILRRTPGGYAVQRDILRGTATATAGDLAAVYTTLATGGGGPAGEIVRRHLEHTDPDGYTAIGHKGGSLPGVLADAMEIRREDGTTAVAVLITNEVPEEGNADMLLSFAWQDLMLRAVDSRETLDRLTCGE